MSPPTNYRQNLKNWEFEDSIYPDFGFNAEVIQNRGKHSWHKVYDFVNNRSKYQRLESYVQARVVLLNEI